MIVFGLAIFAVVLMILVKLQLYKACAYIFLVLPFIIGFIGGGWVVGKTYTRMAPYFAFGLKRVLNEDISVVRSHQGILEFSNGAIVNSNDVILLRLAVIIVFLLAAAIIVLVLKPSISFMSKKFSPPIYEHLTQFSVSEK